MNAGFGVSLGFADLRREGVWSVMWSVRARARTQSLSWVLSVFDRRAHDCGATIAGWAVSPVSPNVERQLSGSDAGVACSGRSSIGGWAKGRPHPTSPPTSPARRLIEGAGSGNRRDSRSRLSSRPASSRSGSSSPRRLLHAAARPGTGRDDRLGRRRRRRSRISRAAPATSAVVYQQILPSLVEIETRASIVEAATATGLGAGVIVNASGAILTALHVVDGATSDPGLLRRRHRDRRPTIASTDPENDIAVLQAGAAAGGDRARGARRRRPGRRRGVRGRPPARLRRLAHLRRHLGPRPLRRGARTARRCAASSSSTRPSTPATPAGRCSTAAGQVIGIVTALANPSRDGFFIGIGFAVPIGTAGGAANAPPK